MDDVMDTWMDVMDIWMDVMDDVVMNETDEMEACDGELEKMVNRVNGMREVLP
jgi:hypothetical protein